MLKLVFCLRRLPHLSLEDFQHYWRNNHAPLVKKHADTLGILRYVQSHTLSGDLSSDIRRSRGGPEPYDGVAELWFESEESMKRHWADPKAAIAARALLEDERKFIDLAQSPIWYCVENNVHD